MKRQLTFSLFLAPVLTIAWASASLGFDKPDAGLPDSLLISDVESGSFYHDSLPHNVQTTYNCYIYVSGTWDSRHGNLWLAPMSGAFSGSFQGLLNMSIMDGQYNLSLNVRARDVKTNQLDVTLIQSIVSYPNDQLLLRADRRGVSTVTRGLPGQGTIQELTAYAEDSQVQCFVRF